MLFKNLSKEEMMAKRHRLKITVLKELSSTEIYGHALPELADEMTPYCDRLAVGQEFIVEESGAMPAGFCTWAWNDLFPAVTGLRFGGDFPWVNKEGLHYACCTDGTRPVFFKIERL
jgi:uncharacterized repeat protein (TIGR04076 family)